MPKCGIHIHRVFKFCLWWESKGNTVNILHHLFLNPIFCFVLFCLGWTWFAWHSRRERRSRAQGWYWKWIKNRSTWYMSACIDDSHAFQLGFIFWLAFNDLFPPVISAVRGFTHFTMKKHILLLYMYNSRQWQWCVCIHCQMNAIRLQVFGNLRTFLERLCLCALQCVSGFFSRTTVVNSLTNVRVKSWGLITLLWKLATSLIRSMPRPVSWHLFYC